jgi:hypothetical protein
VPAFTITLVKFNEDSSGAEVRKQRASSDENRVLWVWTLSISGIKGRRRAYFQNLDKPLPLHPEFP